MLYASAESMRAHLLGSSWPSLKRDDQPPAALALVMAAVVTPPHVSNGNALRPREQTVILS